MKGTTLRRLVAFVCLTLMMTALTGCLGSLDTGEAGAKKDFADKSLTVYMGKGPAADVVRSSLPEFESQTGLKVDLQIFTNEQLSQKLAVQLEAGSSNPDVIMLRPLEELKALTKNGWLEPLNKYIAADGSYDFQDFSASAVESTTLDGQIMSIPVSIEQQILYYRKDLLKQAGLAVPQTLDELEAAVKLLHDPQGGVYGFVARGQKNALVTQLSSFIYSEGGDFQKGDRATLSSPEAVRGMSRYVRLLKDYGPPGVLNMGWPQAMGVFMQGKAAFYTDASAIYSTALQSDRSLVADKVGYAMFPAGKAGAKPYNITAWGLSMNAASGHKQSAWAFIRWATSKELVIRSQQKGNPGARNSAWNTPEGMEGFPKDYISVVSRSIQIGVGHDRPQVINVGEARDIVGNIIMNGLLGEDIQAKAEQANTEFQAIIDREKHK